MAMADLKRAAGSRGGEVDSMLRAQPDAVAAPKQACSDFVQASSQTECERMPGRGQDIGAYDALADLDRIIAGDADDACRARLDAWLDAQHNARHEAWLDAQHNARHEAWLDAQHNARHEAWLDAQIKKRIDYDIRVGIPRDMVRAYALPPVPNPS